MEFLSWSPLGADGVEIVMEISSVNFPRMSPVPTFLFPKEAGFKASDADIIVPHESDIQIEDDRASIASSSGSPGSDHSETLSNSVLSDGSGMSRDLDSISMRGAQLSISAPADGNWEEDSASNFSSSVFESTRTCTTPTSDCSEASWKAAESGRSLEVLQKVGSAEYMSSGSNASDKERRTRKKGSVRRLESRMQTLELGTKTFLPHGCVKFAHKRNVIITAPTEILGANVTAPVGAGLDTVVTVDVAGVGRPHRVLRVSSREPTFNVDTMVEPEDLYDQLWVALQFGDDAELIKSLLPKRVMSFSLSEPKDFGSWPDKYAIVGEAASQGRLKTLSYLLDDLKCDPSAPYGKGLRSPLQIAAYNGHVEVCKLLLRFGAKVDHRDLNDETPLAAAIHAGHYHIARLIREQLDGKGGNSITKAECPKGEIGLRCPTARPVPAWRSRVQVAAVEGDFAAPTTPGRSQSFNNQSRARAEPERRCAPREDVGENSSFRSAGGLRSVSWKEAEAKPQHTPSSGSSSLSRCHSDRIVVAPSSSVSAAKAGPSSPARALRASDVNTWRPAESREYRLLGQKDDEGWRSERPTSGRALPPTWKGNHSTSSRRGGDDSTSGFSSYSSYGASRSSEAVAWRRK